MKKFSAFLIVLSCTFTLIAQINYPPSLCENLNGTYSDLGSSGTPIAVANYDDANSSPIPIGFNFTFNGATQTHFILNTNGFIKLGTSAAMTAPTAALFFAGGNNYTGGIFNSTAAEDINLLSVMNHDFEAAAPGRAEFRTSTTGAAGSRVCTIQFKNLRDKTTTPVIQYDSINFQIKLYETTNIIEYIFGEFYSSTNTSAFKSGACGIKGSNTVDITRVRKGSTLAWDVAVFLTGNYPATEDAFNFGNNVGGARPLPDVGRTFRFHAALPNDIAVEALYTLGGLPIPYGLPHTITVPLRNVGVNNQTNVKVYLSITGANTYADTVNILSITSSGIINATFNGFVPENFGYNNIAVKIDADDNTDNDSRMLVQEINENEYSYVDTTTPNPANRLGFSTGTAAGGGFILNKYKINGQRYIDKVSVYLTSDAPGNAIFAVVANSGGSILDQTLPIVPLPSDGNTWYTFDLPNPVLISNSDVYVGLGQNGATYRPVGSLIESPMRTASYYYYGLLTPPLVYTDIQTSGLVDQPAIKAHIVGNDIIIEDLLGVPKAMCASPSETIEVIVKNNDSTLIDFSVDTLKITASTAAPIVQ